jgi:hypothetical protein
MLRITVEEDRTQRRLIVEGQLINSWASELRTACEKARSELNDRELVIDLNVRRVRKDAQESTR